MSCEPSKFDTILEAAQKLDGIYWLRLLGEVHGQYGKMPFWVLLKQRSQIVEAISVLQRFLRPLQYCAQPDVAVSFQTFEGELDCSHDFFMGAQFYIPNVLDCIFEVPQCGNRKVGLFDHTQMILGP